MSGRPTAPTRASARVKTQPTVPGVTRTTRARAAPKSGTPPVEPLPAKKVMVRKPLVSKDSSLEIPASSKPKTKAIGHTSKRNEVPDSDREPIMAFLRIRPHLGEEKPSTPYLTPLSDSTVNMTDPQNGRSKYRFSAVSPSSIYTFSHVFPHDTKQSEFFTKTTLPLVRDVLTGQNALLFTYGVTNSGKTYTVQGGTEMGTAGILPRSLDVIFNSIEGLQGDGRYRPVRLHGIELADDTDLKPPPTIPEPALAEVLGSLDAIAEPEFDIDPTTIKVDRNYEYTIWISYAEVYNEKVYDLLASVKNESDTNIPRPTAAKSLLLTRTALPLRPSPASDTMDTESTGKYIAGLRQFRVHSSSQAKALVRLGQLHRRVFGTLANRESSRSHGMVIIKVVRGHRGEKNNPTSLQTSRLTLVDLAGSERTKHTHTTGDRLKEAGNINKSLMVLGQCMEVMRSNQRKMAMGLSYETSGQDDRVDTRDIKKTLSVVPFRHSKLTEALMDYFIGDGRTVMIVNVNPYDTGYDENSHVMKFAALAREVYVTPAPVPVQRIPPPFGPGKMHGNIIKQLGPLTLKDPDIVPYSRKVTISIGGQSSGKKPVEAILEVREEDERPDEPDQDDGEPFDPLVDTLFDEIENLRLQLFDAEMRCATIEADTREEVIQEMENRMRAMEQMHSRRLMSVLVQNELKTNEKIDMLHQSGLFGSPSKKPARYGINNEISEERDIEPSLIEYGEESSEADKHTSNPMSPWKAKMEIKAVSKSQRENVEKRPFIAGPPMLPSAAEEAELTETELDDEENLLPSSVTASELSDEDDDEPYSDKHGDDDWEPPMKTPQAKQPRSTVSSAGHSQPNAVPKSFNNQLGIAKLTKYMDNLDISENDGADSSINQPHESSNMDDNDEDFDLPVVKKKKRQLGTNPVINEEGINKMAYAVETSVPKMIRRFVK